MRVAICDDIPEIAHQTDELLVKYSKKHFNTDVFYDPERLLDACENEHYDFFILDIEMPSMSGVELAEKIREKDVGSPIIFLTSYKEYMEDVFRLQTFDYLLKPIAEEKMFALLDRILKYLNVSEKRFAFTFNKISHSLLLSEILYFEKNKRTVFIHTKTQELEMLMTTNELLKQLDEQFVQVHNSYIVNIQYVKELRKNEVLLTNGVSVPMSRSFAKKTQEVIFEKLRGMM